MTLFNKLSNFAHKTKDNAIAKNIISKDKRLDLPLSNTIQLDMIHFDQVTNFGLESKISVMAYDPTAGLLAVGISSTIPLPNIEPIKYLLFKTGCSLLVLIDKKNIIYTLDLKKQHIQHMLPTKGVITSYCYATGTDWLFIGFADGCIDVFDLRLGQLAKYGIPDLINNNERVASMVVTLEMHSTNLNWLLIGYESMVFLWNIREQMIHSTYALKPSPASDIRLTSLTWCPQGDRFMAGYDDGYLHLWAVDSEHQPVLSRQVFPSLDKSQPCEAVYKLSWYFDDGGQKSYLVVCGGSAIKDIHGVHVLEFDMNQQGDARKQSIIPSSTDIMDFTLLWSDPYSSRNPLGILLLGCDGSLFAHGLDHGYPELTVPPSLAMTHPFVSNACFIPMAAQDVYRKLTTLTDADRQTRYLPLTGGGVGPRHVYKIPSNDILVTIHVGEVIQFWDASYTSLRPLSQLTIRCHDDLKDTTNYICCIDLNSVTGTLSVGFNNGTVILYDIVDNQPSSSLIIEDHQQQSEFDKTNTHFISQCDDTLNELADILDDMQNSPIEEPHDDHQYFDKEAAEMDSANVQSSSEPPAAIDSSTINPFITQDNVDSSTKTTATTTHHHHLDQHSDSRITILKGSTKVFGYSPDLKIKLDGSIEFITSTGLEM
ncbi:WD40-repeat-containing domain protein [Chlamydoabsidia padenii]|nr:WD40-repeat-containing domain protein [Chlamydoabsidia padenii]